MPSKPPPGTVVAVVLAAGAASRFGRAKLLRRLGAETLLARAARLAAEATGRTPVVVLGARAGAHRAALRGLDAVAVINARWRLGPGSSLAAGLRRVPRGARAALVLLADQASIPTPALRGLIRRWQREPARPVAADHAGHAGPPAIIPRCYWPVLLRGSGAAGARRVLRDPAARTIRVEVEGAGADVDRPDDLERLRRRWARVTSGAP